MLLRRSESDFRRNFIRDRSKNGVSMNLSINGLHHVTAIASDPQRNLDFYVGLLGLRFVKRTVNFDDPGTYHFYFGDARGTPGTILTFFSWPGARRGIRGTGQIEATAFAIPPESVEYWLDRFKEHHVPAERTSARFGEEIIRFADPDGLLIELSASISIAGIEPWSGSTVPVWNNRAIVFGSRLRVKAESVGLSICCACPMVP